MTRRTPTPVDQRLRERSNFPWLVGALLAVGGAVFGSGCQSSGKPDSASFASVEIRGWGTTQIEETTTAVFLEHGYSLKSGLAGLKFEKEGTRTDQAAYGGWLDEGRVKIRVRAEVVPLGAGLYRLQCKAWMVKNPGDAHFEEETKLTNLSSRPYHKLLDEVAGRLK